MNPDMIHYRPQALIVALQASVAVRASNVQP